MHELVQRTVSVTNLYYQPSRNDCQNFNDGSDHDTCTVPCDLLNLTTRQKLCCSNKAAASKEPFPRSSDEKITS